MNESRISVRYARAVFETALERNCLEETVRDMQLILVASHSEEFRSFTDNPTIPPSVKKLIFGKAFSGMLSSLTMDACSLVIKNGRERYLPSIARNLLSMSRKNLGITSVTLTTSSVYDNNVGERIRKEIERAFSTKVEMECITDPSLIGGFVIRIDDRLYDASVRKQLETIRKKMSGD